MNEVAIGATIKAACAWKRSWIDKDGFIKPGAPVALKKAPIAAQKKFAKDYSNIKKPASFSAPKSAFVAAAKRTGNHGLVEALRRKRG